MNVHTQSHTGVHIHSHSHIHTLAHMHTRTSLIACHDVTSAGSPYVCDVKLVTQSHVIALAYAASISREGVTTFLAGAAGTGSDKSGHSFLSKR